MRIKIIKCDNPKMWYADRIGEEFDNIWGSTSEKFPVYSDTEGYVRKGDYVEVSQPITFSLDSVMDEFNPKREQKGMTQDEQEDNVNHPKHYNKVPGIECIDVVRHFNFPKGNAIKYIWRSEENGNELEDLKKAIWYLEDEIRSIEQGI